MKYSLLISFFLLIIAYPTEQDGAKSRVGDEIDIDGKNFSIPDTGNVIPPEPYEPTTNTTVKPSTTTTSPNSTTTTVPPTNATTTVTPTNGTTPVVPTNATTTITPTNKTTTVPVTTPIAPTSSSVPTTVNPSVPTTVKPEQPERRFDGPSFVGGIVLALGLVAIGFVAFKFYKARTELNYHTL